MTSSRRRTAPSLVTQCPRKSLVGSPNWHLAGVMISLCWLSHSERVWRCGMYSDLEVLAMRVSSGWMKRKGRSRSTESIGRLALHSQGKTTANSPNGVITAILEMPSWWTGNWWYPQKKSTWEKMTFLARWAEKSCMCGAG